MYMRRGDHKTVSGVQRELESRSRAFQRICRLYFVYRLPTSATLACLQIQQRLKILQKLISIRCLDRIGSPTHLIGIWICIVDRRLPRNEPGGRPCLRCCLRQTVALMSDTDLNLRKYDLQVQCEFGFVVYTVTPPYITHSLQVALSNDINYILLWPTPRKHVLVSNHSQICYWPSHPPA